jgi:hypothetical protein
MILLHSDFIESALTPLQWMPRAGVTRGWSWVPSTPGRLGYSGGKRSMDRIELDLAVFLEE